MVRAEGIEEPISVTAEEDECDPMITSSANEDNIKNKNNAIDNEGDMIKDKQNEKIKKKEKSNEK